MRYLNIGYITLMGMILTSCQFGPNYYLIPEEPPEYEYESSGSGYQDSVQAALMARDLTDAEIDAADDLPGSGYGDGKWTGENSDKVAIQHIFEGNEGEIFILEDDGEVVEV